MTGPPVFELRVRLGDSEFSSVGAAELVREAFEEFKTLLDSRPAVVSTATAAAPPRASLGPAVVSSPEVTGRVPFAVFMGRDWRNQAAKATAIYTWALRHDGRDKLKPGEMAALWKRIDKRPGNPTMACQRAERQGWLEALGGGFYAVTGHGENMVANTPPATT
jgi:hypothetical protein